MSRPLEKVRAEVLQLSREDRAELAGSLIASLEDEEDSDPAAVEQAWADEIRRRLADYDAGRTKAIPADEVFAEARRFLA
jgi:putative addiction module component (TIGR02574 family)